MMRIQIIRIGSLIFALISILIVTVGDSIAQTAAEYEAVADSMIDAGDLDGASEALRDAYSLDESNTNILRKLAEVSMHRGDFAAARQALDLVVETDQTDVDSYLEIARLEWLAGSLDVSMQYVNLAEQVSVSPNDKIPAYRSIVYRGMGRLAEAESLLVAARDVYPDSPLILANLGMVRALRGEPDEGFDHVKRAYSLDSNSVFVISSLAGMHLADGNLDEAERLYKRALEIDPLNYFTRQSVENFDQFALETKLQKLMRDGVRYFDRSLYLRARNAFREAVNLDSTYFDSHINLGFTLNILGEPRTALEVFKRAEAIDSMSAPLYIGMGNAYAGIAEFEQAMDCYNRAIELDSNIVEARQALKTVKELLDAGQGENR